jgi:hypothetical protein
MRIGVAAMERQSAPNESNRSMRPTGDTIDENRVIAIADGSQVDCE